MNIRKTYTVCVLAFLLSAIQSSGWSQQIDSLFSVLQTSRQDVVKVKALNELSQAFIKTGKFDTALVYARKALQIAGKINNPQARLSSFQALADVYKNKQDSANARKYYQEALSLAYQLRNDTDIVNTLLQIGSFYNAQYVTAQKYYQEAIQTAKKSNYPKSLLKSYSSLSHLYLLNYNYPKAYDLIQNALTINHQINDKETEIQLLSDLGTLYWNTQDTAKGEQNIDRALQLAEAYNNKGALARTLSGSGYFYMNTGRIEKAITLYNRSATVALSIGDKFTAAVAYANLAYIFQLKTDYKKSIDYHTKSLTLFQAINSRYGLMLYWKDVGTLVFFAPDSILKEIDIAPKNRYDTAIAYERRALSLVRQLQIGEQEFTVLVYLFNMLKETGNYREPYTLGRRLILLKDSLINKDKQRLVIQKEMQLNFGKKLAAQQLAQEKKDIRQKNIRNSFIVGLVVILVFLVVVFRQRNKIRREHDRSEELLLNILPEEVAEELKARGRVKARQFDSVSVLFTDFVHFTQDTEQLDPKQIVQELNECFTVFDQIMERNGLEKIKTIGDIYMAVCGLPHPDPLHAQKAVRAALEILAYIEQRRRTEKAFEIKIGIHSGSVIAGIVGIKKFAYDIWGDTVNTASRMESSSESGKINISEATFQLVKDELRCVYRGQISAKGKGEMNMYFVTG